MRTILALTLLAGCVAPTMTADAGRKNKDKGEPPAAASDEALPPVPAESVLAMHRQLALVDDLRMAVVQGDLDAALVAGRKLETLPPLKEAPPEWGPWLLRVKESAGRVKDAWGLDPAARTVADIGRTCGGCHFHLQAGPAFAGDGDPGEAGEGIAPHMAHHAAAMEGMWQGLVMADDLRFARAAKALAEAHPAEGDAAGPLDEKVHKLAAYGARVKGLASRADTYGALLATCAECHAAEAAE